MAKTNANQLIGMVEDWYSKLPPLPKNWTEVIAKVTPWVALVFGILGVLAALAAFGIFTVAAPFVAMGSGVGAASGNIVASVFWFISSALMLAAFPGTRAMKMSGWTLLFYSEVAHLLSSVVIFSVSGVIGALIVFYVLFQIKSHYK